MTDSSDEQIREFQEWIEEPLNPELEPYVVEGGMFARSLKHPLVFDIGLTLPGRCNRAYEYKTARLAKAIAEKDWHQVVFLHERPYRTEALINYVVGRDEDGTPLQLGTCDKETQDLACQVWRDSENLQQHEDDWYFMLSGGDVLLDVEPEVWNALPDPLTIYRGEIDDGGFSWSLDEKIAQWFANRFDAGMDLSVGQVAKKDVVGYLAGRGEEEILVLDPDAVTILETRKNEEEQ